MAVIKKIVLEVGGKEINMTVEEANEIKGVLNTIFREDDFLEKFRKFDSPTPIIIERPYPVPYTPPRPFYEPRPWYGTTTTDTLMVAQYKA